MKVIRSPIVYEAEQFHSNGNIPKCVLGNNNFYTVKCWYSIIQLKDGDWIVTDPDGLHEVYPEDEFRRIFERVED